MYPLIFYGCQATLFIQMYFLAFFFISSQPSKRNVHILWSSSIVISYIFLNGTWLWKTSCCNLWFCVTCLCMQMWVRSELLLSRRHSTQPMDIYNGCRRQTLAAPFHCVTAVVQFLFSQTIVILHDFTARYRLALWSNLFTCFPFFI